ncbi:hypothetical protein UPYG_G00080700 [Umbra pygmaea]|uniref:Uncharacterized protein n=1 Tax=Umbra pygmaea TaxID=75934 RepID=A0ABD0XDL8_UMBPY
MASSGKKFSVTEALAIITDDSWTPCVPADSDSEDEDLLRRDQPDSGNEDYRGQRLVASDGEDDFRGDEPSPSAAALPQPRRDCFSEALPSPSAAALPQPQGDCSSEALPSTSATPLPQPRRDCSSEALPSPSAAALPQPRRDCSSEALPSTSATPLHRPRRDCSSEALPSTSATPLPRQRQARLSGRRRSAPQPRLSSDTDSLGDLNPREKLQCSLHTQGSGLKESQRMKKVGTTDKSRMNNQTRSGFCPPDPQVLQ